MNKKNISFHKKIFSTFLIFTLLTFSTSSFSLTYNIQNNKKYTTLEDHLKKQRAVNSSNVFGGAEEVLIENTKKEKAPYFTNEQLIQLDIFLNEENYPKFYEYINNSNVSEGGMIKYLLTKSLMGHIPTYWLLAHLYSFEKNNEETHKWFYVALIMTQQDAELCSDSSAKIASKTLLRDFNNIVDIINRTPQHIVPSMQFAGDFIRTLKQRTNPKWVCSYGIYELAEKENITIPLKYWNETRNAVLKDILSKYGLK